MFWYFNALKKKKKDVKEIQNLKTPKFLSGKVDMIIGIKLLVRCVQSVTNNNTDLSDAIEHDTAHVASGKPQLEGGGQGDSFTAL